MAKKKESAETRTFRVAFHTPDFMPSNIATNIVVQRLEDNFKVSLYELKPDIILTDEARNEMEKRGTVRADCVGSFVISPTNLKKFLDVLNEQLSKYEKQKEEVPVTASSTLP